MLRHLLSSAARTSSRLSFAKSSTVVLAARPPPVRSFWWQLKEMIKSPPFLFFVGSIGTMFAIKKPMDDAKVEWTRSIYSKNSCYITKSVSSTSEPVDAATQSIKKPDLFEDGNIIFAFENPSFLDDSTRVTIGAAVQISNISLTSDYNEICDGLERRGIHVERSVFGAGKGLSEYAATLRHESLAKYSAMKDDSRFSQTAFDDSRVVPDPLTQTFQSKTFFNAFVISTVAHLIHPATFTVPMGIILGHLAAYFYLPKTFHSSRSDDRRHKINLPFEPAGAAQSSKNRDPFENGTFELLCSYPAFLVHGSRSDLFAEAKARIDLPRGTKMKEIREGLERRGIHVDNSKEGVRRGLTEYAIKLMNEEVAKHHQKKCACFDPSVSTSKTSKSFQS